MIATDLPEEQHRELREAQGKEFVERAAAELYYGALQCRADGHPWPADLDEAHKILCKHLGRDEELRRAIIGPVEEDANAA